MDSRVCHYEVNDSHNGVRSSIRALRSNGEYTPKASTSQEVLTAVLARQNTSVDNSKKIHGIIAYKRVTVSAMSSFICSGVKVPVSFSRARINLFKISSRLDPEVILLVTRFLARSIRLVVDLCA